jgi:hypothetical protein
MIHCNECGILFENTVSSTIRCFRATCIECKCILVHECLYKCYGCRDRRCNSCPILNFPTETSAGMCMEVMCISCTNKIGSPLSRCATCGDYMCQRCVLRDRCVTCTRNIYNCAGCGSLGCAVTKICECGGRLCLQCMKCFPKLCCIRSNFPRMIFPIR